MRRLPPMTVVLVLAGMMVMLDTVVTIVAIPRLVGELGTSLTVVQWVTTGYVLALVATMPASAWLAGRLGSRRVYVAALVTFTAASALVTLAWNIESLIVFRVLQGVGGGLLNPVGQSIALRAVDRERRGAMMSVTGLPVLFGPLIGPILSGWLIDALSWRWIFAINIPIGVAAIVLALRLVPRQQDDRPAPLDWLGLALLPTGAVLLVLGLGRVGEAGRFETGATLVIAVGLTLVALFAVRATRIAHPLIHIRLLGNRTFATGAAVLFLFGLAYFGQSMIMTNYIQAIRDVDPLDAGLMSVPQALATGITLQIATRLVDRVPARRIVATGITLALLGTVGLWWAVGHNASYAVLIALSVLLGTGAGATLMPTVTATIRDLRQDLIPSGSSLVNLQGQIANGVGTAVITALLTIGFNRIPVVADDGLAGVLSLSAADRTRALPELGAAAAWPYLVAATAMAVALVITTTFLGNDGSRRKTRRGLHQAGPSGPTNEPLSATAASVASTAGRPVGTSPEQVSPQ